jgi:hypothetical protein
VLIIVPPCPANSSVRVLDPAIAAIVPPGTRLEVLYTGDKTSWLEGPVWQSVNNKR